MTSVIPPLLLIPELQPTESLRAFMYRAAQDNKFPRMYAGSAHTLKHAGRLLSQLEGQDYALCQELRLRLAPPLITNHMAQGFFLGKESIPSSCIRIEARSVCPLCLTKDQWSRGEWEIKAYTTCHLHGVSLVDKCDQCHQKLSWSRTEISRCYCGRAFSSMSPASSKDWERKWATQVHLAFSHSISDQSKRTGSGTNISKLLLMIDVVRAVIVPSKFLRKHSNDEPSRLVAKMLMAPDYRSCLWESIFLYAAETPLSLSEKLSPGQTNNDLVRNYQRFAEISPIPLDLKPKLSPRKIDSYGSTPRVTAIKDVRSHVARLKHLYGARTDKEFNPFTMSRAEQRAGRL
jgi:TniQ